MKYGYAAIQMTSGHDVKQNLASAKKLIAEAVDQGAKLVVLPEMFAVMGLDQMDKVKTREPFGHGPIQDFLQEQAQKHDIWLVGGTIPISVEQDSQKVSACCLLYDNHGAVVARYDKIHLFDIRISEKEAHHESKTTYAGEKITVAETPFGKLGLAVCYDVRFPEMFRKMHEQNVEVVILPAAFTYTTGAAHWDILVRARAIENQVYVVASAQTGVHENQRKTYGHSMIVNPWGVVLAIKPEGQGVIVADIDIELLQKMRTDFPFLTHRRI